MEKRNGPKSSKRKKLKKVRPGQKAHDQLDENFQQLTKSQTEDDQQFLKRILKEHHVLQNMNDSELLQIAKSMNYCLSEKGEYIIRQGDVEKGRIQVHVNNVAVKELGPGAKIGDLALLYNQPRSASIKSLSDCYFWYIDRNAFLQNVQKIIMKQSNEIRPTMNQVPIFDCLSTREKDGLSKKLIQEQYKKGEFIVKEGELSNCLYIIQHGEVKITMGGKFLRRMEPYDYFGESCLFHESVRHASVQAERDVTYYQTTVLAMTTDSIQNIVGKNFHEVLYRNLHIWTIEKTKYLKQLTKIQINKILDKMKIDKVKAGTTIFRKGQYKDERLLLLIEGCIVNKSNPDNILLRNHSMWGAEQFMDKPKMDKFQDNYQVVTDSIISTISRENFTKIIKGELKNKIKENQNSHERKLGTTRANAGGKAFVPTLDELKVLKELGHGEFGTVFLVGTKNKFYALKCIDKIKIQMSSLEKYIKNEQEILEFVHHPFIMNMVTTFQDDNNEYFLTEFIRGIELFDVIREIGLLNMEQARFYIASLILCIEYLHYHHIIYRDIKPENVMCMDNGYLKLIDMGTAKFLKSKKRKDIARTWTIIGSPQYMAPEIIEGHGYSFAVDVYSIGVCFYEFISGFLPFGEELEDPFEIYQVIIQTQDLVFPDYVKDKQAMKLIKRMLAQDPQTRTKGKFPRLKSDPFFKDFDWDSLMDKDQKAPFYVPTDKLINLEKAQRALVKAPKIKKLLKKRAKKNKIQG